MEIFQATRNNLHPNIVRLFEKMEQWHIENGYGPADFTLDELIEKYIAATNGIFTILIQDGGKKHHGNCLIMVFNKEGMLVDVRIYFNPIEDKKVPKKAFVGTPIIDGSKIMKFKPPKRKDKPFQPPI